ncbi:putative polyglutamine synthesis accessory protein [Mycobacterium pseudokansasii]|uniref:Putative polyglutamine synthesis accessory protein n=1 Tax=Mycobacterium pseudokansasii TaxID=2341080 RepID=A0A498QNN4_9MYCO|nr:putative polyglutamine synthesis accessory protein [Mycobacterium pseudokansasii]
MFYRLRGSWLVGTPKCGVPIDGGRRWFGVVSAVVTLLGGDVMLGRGVDQILAHPGHPELRERYLRDATGYVRLAERVNGPIPRPVDWRWPWGEVLDVLDDVGTDVRVVNLETTITTGTEFADRKPVCYRMHPDNLAALTTLRPDACALANNHILDFGYQGLTDTVAALAAAGIRGAGAGPDLPTARRPAVVTVGDRHRVVIGSVATTSSGVPESWAAQHNRPGVWLVRDPSQREAADDVAAQVLAGKGDGKGDGVTVVSVHWGSNWGYAVAPGEIAFAHRLIDAGIDIVHGHSSHHPRPIEIYRGKPIMYGCGDVIDDYEGIGGHESFRGDLRLLYLTSTDPATGNLFSLKMIPLRVKQMRLHRASSTDTEWLRRTIEHVSRRFGIRVTAGPDDLLEVSSAGDTHSPVAVRG